MVEINNNSDLVECIDINRYQDLIDIIKNSSSAKCKYPIDFRRKCIFRGCGSKDYKLIPSALRQTNDGEKVIKEYIDSNNFFNEYHSAVFDNLFEDNDEDSQLQFKRELFILFKFLDWSDKSGLKIPFTTGVRKLLHSHIKDLDAH